MGGMISTAGGGALYPDRVLSLTSIMSTSGEWGKGVASLKVARQMTKTTSKNRSALDNSVETWRLIGSPAYPMSDESVRAQLVAEHKRSNYPAGYMRQIAAIRTAPGRAKLLQTIKVPVLVIHGQQDLLVPVSGGIDTAKHIPQAELALFEGMGHTLPQALLTTFAELIVKNSQKIH